MEPSSDQAEEPSGSPRFSWEHQQESLSEQVMARGQLGGYRLLGVLGQGGMGLVFRALDPELEREVALKVMLQPTPKASERFIREARLTAGLDHPGVVRVHDAGVDEGHAYIVYELIEGARSLDQVLPQLGWRERTMLISQAALAVGAAHAAGIIHRDLKPENLLVDASGRLRVLDFGLALGLGEERLTKTGQALGTPLFMAPEQMIGGKLTGPPADVWALGVVLYQALTDRLPFEASTWMELLAQVQRASIVPPRRVDPSVDSRVEAVCLRALQRDPGDRYPDAQALAQALEDALGPPQSSSWRPWSLVGAAAAGILVAAALTGPRLGAETEARSASGPPTADDGPAPTAGEAPISDRLLLAATTPRWAVWADARRVLTGGPAEDMRLWDAATGQELRSWRRTAATAVPGGPGRVALASDTGLSLLDVDTAGKRPTSVGRFVSVRQVAYATRADAWAVIAQRGGADGWGAFVVSSDGARREAPLPSGSSRIVSLGVSVDGAYVALGARGGTKQEASSDMPVLSGGGRALVYEQERGRYRLQKSILLPAFASVCAFNPRTRDLVVGTASGHVALIPRTAPDIMGQFHTTDRAHNGPVRGLDFSADGRTLYSLGEHGLELEVKTWDYDSLAVRGPALRAPGRPHSLDLSPDGAALAIGTADRGVLLRTVAR